MPGGPLILAVDPRRELTKPGLVFAGEPVLLPREVAIGGIEGRQPLLQTLAVRACDGLRVRVHATFVGTRAILEVPGLFEGLHEWHVNGFGKMCQENSGIIAGRWRSHPGRIVLRQARACQEIPYSLAICSQ